MMPLLILAAVMTVGPPQIQNPPPTTIGRLQLTLGGRPGASSMSGVVGLSAAVTAIPWVELEAGFGVEALLFPEVDWYIRAGPRWRALDNRGESGSGQTLDISGLLGLRSMHHLNWDPLLNPWRALDASISVTPTFWGGPHLGFHFSLNVGLVRWLGWAAEIPRTGPQVRVGLGLSF